ncbi:hypothetical protein MPRS_23300 [Mycobacterium paraseoulense]|nr:hypothetical protein [Mycobacterium paraseoulense]BBZ71237.1 hypothetical protein MPRS_23300 [Mycobacterium paraseoulense]
MPRRLINKNLTALLDDILRDSGWDMPYLGMQVLIEGLALAAFGVLRDMAAPDSLGKQVPAYRYPNADGCRILICVVTARADRAAPFCVPRLCATFQVDCWTFLAYRGPGCYFPDVRDLAVLTTPNQFMHVAANTKSQRGL